MAERISMVTLTGGPGGGKSCLLRKIAEHAELGPMVVVTEEAIHGMRFVRLDPRTRQCQCALVAIQAATEESLKRALAGTSKRLIVSHRGTLDPCAFWQSFGNSRESFFEMTGTTLEDHYRRYDLVIHMESAAVRVPEAYVRCNASVPLAVPRASCPRLRGSLHNSAPGPAAGTAALQGCPRDCAQARRPEDIAQAARLDRLLGELWGGHPRYVKIEGTRDFEEKIERGMAVIRGFLASQPGAAQT